MAGKGLSVRSEAELQVYLAARAEWTTFRQKTRQLVLSSLEPEVTGPRNNKVDAIGRFLTKLSKPNNFSPALIDELNKFNLKNFREDLASALAEAVQCKFDLSLMIKIFTNIWLTYTDNEYRQGLFESLNMFLKNKHFDQLKGTNAEVRVGVFRLFFELLMIGFPMNKKVLIAAFLKCITPESEAELLAALPLINMFVEDIAECFLNHQSLTLHSLLKKFPSLQYKDPSLDEVFLNEEQKKFIHLQIQRFENKLKDTFNTILTEKSRLEDDLHSLYKNGSEMSAEKKDKYNSLCLTYENIRHTGTLLKEFFNLEFSVPIGDEPAGDPTLANFINNTTREYTREQLGQFFDDEKETYLYLNLIDPELIKESTASNVILETNDDKKLVYKDFVETLKECTTVQAADNLTEKFSEINTQKTRKLLVQDILDFRQDYHLVIGYICRILANLDQKYPTEIRKHLTTKLLADYELYKGGTSRTGNYLFDNRVRNVYFLIECTKFRLVSPDHLLNVLIKSAERFEAIDKHIIIKTLELAGRFLKRYDESKDKFRFNLDNLTKKIRSCSVSDYLCRQIDTCINYCNRETLDRAQPAPEKSLLEEYLENLVYTIDRSRESLDKMKEEFLRLPWRKCWQLMADTIIRLVLTLRHTQINPLCYLIEAVGRLHPRTVTYIKDVALEIVCNRVSEGYVFYEKQDVITYTIFLANLFNESCLSLDETLRFLLCMIEYSMKERRFKFPDGEDFDNNFRVAVVIEFLEQLPDVALNRDLRAKVFLQLFQVYVLSRSYIPSQLEYQIVANLKRLYPNIALLRKDEEAKVQHLLKLLEERTEDRLAKNLRSLELSSHHSHKNNSGSIPSPSPRDAGDMEGSSSISRKVEFITEQKKQEYSQNMKTRFEYDMSLLADKFSDAQTSSCHVLSRTSVAELRKKAEARRIVGSKLLVRNNNKYDFKTLRAPPVAIKKAPKEESEGDEEDEGDSEEEEGEPYDEDEADGECEEEYDDGGEEDKDEESDKGTHPNIDHSNEQTDGSLRQESSSQNA